MGWNDHIGDDDQISSLPDEAWESAVDTGRPFNPNDSWLRTARRAEQLVAMRGWFHARYCDPAHETPYIGREGGYFFVNGGPFNPSTELHQRFGGVIDDVLIEQVVEEMFTEVGHQWAPAWYCPPDDYDERFDLERVDADEPLRRVRKRLAECAQVLELEGGTGGVVLARSLVFGAIIGVLESFLWEIAQHWIESSEDALRSCVTRLPAIRDQQIKLGDIFVRHESIRDLVKGHLQNTVWHRWDKVSAIYDKGLGIALPSMKIFGAALVKRHDIVHRSGRTKAGEYVNISVSEIEVLSQHVERFAAEVSELAKQRFLVQSSL